MRLKDNANYMFVGGIAPHLVTGLLAAIESLPDDYWTGFRRKTDMHDLNADVQSIAVRHGIQEGFPMYRNTKAWEALKDPLKPVLSVLPGADRIRIAKLKAKGGIKPHIDAAPYFEKQHRLHIPLKTNPDCWFFVRGEGWRMLPGEIWEINNIHVHSVVNDGDEDRIHLIVDYYDI